MNWILLIVLLGTGIVHTNEARGERTNKAKQVDVSNPTVSKEKQTEIVREELQELLDHDLPKVSNQAHHEVKQLNSLITSAVSQNSYSKKNFRPPDKTILKLKNTEVGLAPLALALAAPPPKNTNVHEITITDNIIESNILSDLLNQTSSNISIWHPHVIGKSHLNREIFKLNYVIQNYNYNYKNITHIKLWKLIKINFSINLLIGLSYKPANNGSQLILIKESGFKFTCVKTVTFPQKINEFDIINVLSNKYLVAIENDTLICFYKIVAERDTYELEKINELDLHKRILHLKLFSERLDDIRLIFVTEFNGQISADLYEFELQSVFNFWLVKTIPLSSRCRSIAILDTGRDYIVAFPQMNKVLVYKYEKDIFKQLDTIETANVTDVAGFSMGGFSYLAVGGLNPQILKYDRGQLRPQSMLSQSFGLVEQWFPISARTYRDDLMLLVQYRIKFETHSLSALHVLVWDGESFNILPTTPCYLNGIESQYGITCMLDIEQDTDIAGSVILQHGKKISILVPQGEEPSQLFDLISELAPVDNPLQNDVNELTSIYKILSKLVHNFDSSMQSIQNTIDNAVNLDEYTVIPASWEIETLEFENTFDNDTKIGAAFVGDIQISKEETELYLSYLESLIDEALIKFEESSNRPKRQESTPDTNIQFEFLNGIPADELLFGTEDIIELNGIQEFERSIYVENDVIMGNDSKINGISIQRDTINSGSEVVLPTIECDEIEILENLQITNDINGKKFNQENMGRLLPVDGTRNSVIVENMVVGGDLNITRINNLDFGHFLDNIILKNFRTRIEKLSIDGVIFAETEFGINHLNDIPFPDGFVFQNSTSQQDIIRGHKVFTQALVTNEIDTDGEINGIRPSHVVTLGDEQFIPGEITFSHIEVTESLEVNGTIKGQNLDTFRANPTITQTNIINSSCIFNELEVEGNVYLVEIENQNLDSILQNVVYNDEPDEFINVNVLKIFDTVYVETDHFTVTSNLVNNKFGLDKYLSKSADQTLSIKYLNGTVKVNTLTLAGLFNGVNVTELDLNSIKIGGDQYIDKRIKFQHPIRAKNLKILEKINKKSTTQLINTKIGGNILIHSNFEVEHLEIDQLNTNGNIQIENGELNEINLNEFDKLRFSLSRPQTISGTFFFKSATVEGDLNPHFLNDVNLENFKSVIEEKRQTVADIFSGKVPIRHIIVKGNATINNINGYNMDKIIQNVIWLDRPNIISNRLTFLDECLIQGDLDVLSRVNTKFNLNSVFDHMVYRDDQPIVINEKKIFANGIIVRGNCTTEYINDVAIRNLVLSNRMNHIKNKIIITGNLQVNNLNAPYINDFKLSELTSLYHYDENTKTHYLNSDNVQFTSPQETPRLYINGSINDLFNVDEFLKNMVQLDKPINFDSNLKLFQTNLRFTKNLVVENLNSINLDNYFEQLVHIDEEDPVIINGNIEFLEEITVNHLRVGGDLITQKILGYDPNQWLKNQFYINENIHVQVPLNFERGTFYATAIDVKFLNGIDMSKVLTYNTEQVFEDAFIVSEIVSFVPVRVHGLVNGLKLPNEVHNTMMRTGNTSIRIPLHIKNLNVHKSVKTSNLINGKNITNLLQIEPHMILDHHLHFNEIETQTIMPPDYYLSGIDFALWYAQSLWKVGRETQMVLSKYTISNVTVGEGGIHGTELVNNKSWNEIVETRNRDQLKLVNELVAHRKELEFICMKLSHLVNLSKQQIYYVKYFNARIMLENENSKIVSKLFFEFNYEKYLLVSGTDCHSTIYRWDPKQIDFHEVFKFHSGYVSDWCQIYVSNSNEIILVSHSITNEIECTKKGVYLWSFNGNSIIENSAVLINPEYEVKSLWTSNKFEKKLFLIAEGLNREPNIFQMNENGKIEKQWKLPINHRRLQFLPSELGFQLALSDGNQIFLINDFPINGNRVKRHHWDIFEGLLKKRQGKLLDIVNNGVQKTSSKYEDNFKRRIYDLDEQDYLLVGSGTTKATIATTYKATDAEAVFGEIQVHTTSSVDNDPSNSKTTVTDADEAQVNDTYPVVSDSSNSETAATDAEAIFGEAQVNTTFPVISNPSNSKMTATEAEAIFDEAQINATSQAVSNPSNSETAATDAEAIFGEAQVNTTFPVISNPSNSEVAATDTETIFGEAEGSTTSPVVSDPSNSETAATDTETIFGEAEGSTTSPIISDPSNSETAATDAEASFGEAQVTTTSPVVSDSSNSETAATDAEAIFGEAQVTTTSPVVSDSSNSEMAATDAETIFGEAQGSTTSPIISDSSNSEEAAADAEAIFGEAQVTTTPPIVSDPWNSETAATDAITIFGEAQGSTTSPIISDPSNSETAATDAEASFGEAQVTTTSPVVSDSSNSETAATDAEAIFGEAQVTTSSPVVSDSSNSETAATDAAAIFGEAHGSTTSPIISDSSNSAKAAADAEAIFAEAQVTTTPPVVSDPSNSETFSSALEQIFDNIFKHIVKTSDKSVKSVQNSKLVSSVETQAPKSFAEFISNNILGATFNLLSTVEQTASQVVDNEEVDSPLNIDKENLASTVDVGYPHLKDITKSIVLNAREAVSWIKKLNELASNFNSSETEILNAEAVTTIYDGYKSVEKLAKNLIETMSNTAENANELANKFELFNDQAISEESSNITTRDVNNVSHVTSMVNTTLVTKPGGSLSYKSVNDSGEHFSNKRTNNSIVETPLDISDEATKNIAKHLENVANDDIAENYDENGIIKEIEIVKVTFKNDNAANEFVNDPNQTYITGVEPSTSNITTNNSTMDTSLDRAATEHPNNGPGSLTTGSIDTSLTHKIINSSIIETPLDISDEVTKNITKHLENVPNDNIAENYDGNGIIKQIETIKVTFKNDNEADEFANAPNQTYITGNGVEPSTINITTNNSTVDTSLDRAATEHPNNSSGSFTSNEITNSSIIETSLDISDEVTKNITKHLENVPNDNIAENYDGNGIIKQIETIKVTFKNDNEADEFANAPNQTYITGVEPSTINITTNNSTVDTSLDRAATELLKNGSGSLTSNEITNSSIIETPLDISDESSENYDWNAIIQQIEIIKATFQNDDDPNELVIAPNPSYKTGFEPSTGNITTNNSTVGTSLEQAATEYPKNGSEITNNSIFGTSMDAVYSRMEKIAKQLVDLGIKSMADFDDFQKRINHKETVGDASNDNDNESSTSKFDAKSPTYQLGRSRIGDKVTKTNPPPVKQEDEELDQIIGQEITYNGVIASENTHIPEKGTGEVVILYVGRNENRRMLTAVSTKTNTSTIPGKHDTIKIYDDILEGKIYQEIHTSKPTGLTALHIGDQTMLAYLEDKIVVQVFVYHGIEGFKHFNEFKLPKLASHLSSTTLSGYGNFACPRHFLIVTFSNKLWFLEAIMEGNCGVDIDLDCSIPLRSTDKV